MDADFPALALAACGLCQRSHRGRAGPRLDRGPLPLHARLFASRGEARAGFWDSGRRCHHSLAGRVGRDRLAPFSWIMNEVRTQISWIAGVWTNLNPAGTFARLIRAKRPA